MRMSILAAALLCACSAQQQQATTDLNTSLARLASVSISDLNAAAADAGQHGDVLAAACYPALANFVMTLQEGSGRIAPPAGAFDAFQKARDVYKGLTGGGGMAAVPTSVKMSCAALFIDVKGDVVQFIALLARIASGSFVPILPLP